MEIPHANLPKVTGMVFVEIRPMVMLSTGHTTTTWMLAVLADTAVAGGNVAATVELKLRLVLFRFERAAGADSPVDMATCKDRRGTGRTAFLFLSIG